ncbi:MAG: tripartite tricarboxylate transporter permease [Candidatus Aenigmatarchaeota archaeon]
MIEYFIAIFSGIIFGFFTGLLPGMSINNLLPIFLTFTFLKPEMLAVFIVSVSISQLLTNFFPSIFLGAPSSETAISILPGHKLLLEGRGYEALKLSLIGSLTSIIFSLILIFILSPFFKDFYSFLRPFIFYPIFFVSLFMILSEREERKILFSFLIFLLSGFLGIVTLNSVLSSQNVLFPMLSGFFGLSTLIVSLKEKSFLPKQKIDEKLRISKKDFLKSSLLGSLFGLLVGFLPAVGVSQAAVMAQYIANLGDPRNFLVTIGAINIANEMFSLNSLYLVNNPRSGASVAIQRILGEMNFQTFLVLIASILISAGITIPLVLFVSKKIYKFLVKVNYTILNLAIIFFLSILVLLFSGLVGILVFIVSGSIGILAVELKVRRSHCMGCLLLPSMIFFSGLQNPLLEILF